MGVYAACLCILRLQELKNELLLILVGTNRGFNIRDRERKALMSQIELLEVRDPWCVCIYTFLEV